MSLSAGYNGDTVGLTSTQDVWIDGIKQTDLDRSASPATGAANIARNPNYRVGSKIDNAEYFGGDIGESFFWGRNLSNAELVENDLYLQRKWGKKNDNEKSPGGVHNGLALWLDASDSNSISTASCSDSVVSPLDSESVSCWLDKSGRENNLTASGTVTYKTSQFNGKEAVLFNGGATTLSDMVGLSGGDKDFTVFVVFDKSSSASTAVPIEFGNASASAGEKWGLETLADGNISNAWNVAQTTTSDTPVDILNKPYVVSMNYAGGGMQSSANQEIYVNGTKKHSLVVSGSSSAAASLPTRPDISIGRDLTGSNSHQGHIAEVVVYDRKLSDFERQAVEAYLSQKWLEEYYSYQSCSELEAAYGLGGPYTIDKDGYNGPYEPQDCKLENVANFTSATQSMSAADDSSIQVDMTQTGSFSASFWFKLDAFPSSKVYYLW